MCVPVLASKNKGLSPKAILFFLLRTTEFQVSLKHHTHTPYSFGGAGCLTNLLLTRGPTSSTLQNLTRWTEPETWKQSTFFKRSGVYHMKLKWGSSQITEASLIPSFCLSLGKRLRTRELPLHCPCSGAATLMDWNIIVSNSAITLKKNRDAEGGSKKET